MRHRLSESLHIIAGIPDVFGVLKQYRGDFGRELGDRDDVGSCADCLHFDDGEGDGEDEKQSACDRILTAGSKY